MAKLTEDERRILSFLNDNADYQVNTWAFPNSVISFRLGTNLQRLKRRDLIDGEGRGRMRQWWITKKGQEVLAAD